MKVLLGIIKMPHLYFIIVQTKQIKTFSGQFINFFGNPKSSWGRGCVEKTQIYWVFLYWISREKSTEKRKVFFSKEEWVNFFYSVCSDWLKKDLYNFKTICTIVTKLLKNCIIFFSRFDLIMLHKNFSQNLCIHTSIHTEHLCSFFQQWYNNECI